MNIDFAVSLRKSKKQTMLQEKRKILHGTLHEFDFWNDKNSYWQNQFYSNQYIISLIKEFDEIDLQNHPEIYSDK